jgi:multisubunit Na+/H+ antiporter MnhG subunit
MAAAFILPVADRAYILIQALYAALGAYALTRAFSPRHLDLDYGLIGAFSALFSLACIAVYPQDAPLLAATAFVALIGLTVPVLQAASLIASGRHEDQPSNPRDFSVIEKPIGRGMYRPHPAQITGGA